METRNELMINENTLKERNSIGEEPEENYQNADFFHQKYQSVGTEIRTQ